MDNHTDIAYLMEGIAPVSVALLAGTGLTLMFIVLGLSKRIIPACLAFLTACGGLTLLWIAGDPMRQALGAYLFGCVMPALVGTLGFASYVRGVFSGGKSAR
jgi:hypothetical protein